MMHMVRLHTTFYGGGGGAHNALSSDEDIFLLYMIDLIDLLYSMQLP